MDEAQEPQPKEAPQAPPADMALSELVRLAKSELQALTNFRPESVISIKKLESGEWKLNIELLERTSIPDKMDILGNYEVMMGSDGAVISYDRKSLRKRGDTGKEEPEEDSA